MTDAELADLIRPHWPRIVAAVRAQLVSAGEGRQAATKPEASGFTPADAVRFRDYFAAGDDGAFPADMHAEFGLYPRQFAVLTGCRMRLGPGGRLAGWVPREEPVAALPAGTFSAEAPVAPPAPSRSSRAEYLLTLQEMILAAHAEGDADTAEWLAGLADDPAAVAQVVGDERLAAWFADWSSSEHPRGQPGNAGQFVRKAEGGTGGAKGDAKGDASTATRTPASGPKTEPKLEAKSGPGAPTASPTDRSSKVPTRQPAKATRAARKYRDNARRRRVMIAVNNEGKLSRAISGANLPDSEPADVVMMRDPSGQPITDPAHIKSALKRREWAVRRLKQADISDSDREQCQRILASPAVFIEVKTLLTAKGHAVHMSKAAQKRKERWMKRFGVTFFTVALDDRRGAKHSGHRVHVVHGFNSTVRLDQMERLPSLEAVGQHIEAKHEEGKAEARRVSGVQFTAANRGAAQ